MVWGSGCFFSLGLSPTSQPWGRAAGLMLAWSPAEAEDRITFHSPRPLGQLLWVFPDPVEWQRPLKQQLPTCTEERGTQAENLHHGHPMDQGCYKAKRVTKPRCAQMCLRSVCRWQHMCDLSLQLLLLLPFLLRSLATDAAGSVSNPRLLLQRIPATTQPISALISSPRTPGDATRQWRGQGLCSAKHPSPRTHYANVQGKAPNASARMEWKGCSASLSHHNHTPTASSLWHQLLEQPAL